jgi:branched-chain amino acid transport system substrate-binding protein
MKKTFVAVLLIGAGPLTAGDAQAADAVACGSGNGQPANGTPIKVGGIFGNAAPGDFSSSA